MPDRKTCGLEERRSPLSSVDVRDDKCRADLSVGAGVQRTILGVNRVMP